MRTHQFFRRVWRFNALVILFAGVLAIGVLAFTAFYGLRAMFREREIVAVVNTDQQQEIREILTLGGATQITGHSWLCHVRPTARLGAIDRRNSLFWTEELDADVVCVYPLVTGGAAPEPIGRS